MPKWVAVHSRQLPVHPGATKIWFGLLLLTLAAFAVTYRSARKGKRSLWAYLLFGYAVAMLVNVLLPHIPATLVFREYTPGVVTAVLINLPIMGILLFQAVREQWVPGDEGNRVRCAGSARVRRRDSGPVAQLPC